MSTSSAKRKRPLLPAQQEQLRQVIAEQIDLDIALKRRLIAYTNARIEWVHVLRKTIVEEEGYIAPVAGPGHLPHVFRDAALATYDAIEEPCRFILNKPFPPRSTVPARAAAAAARPVAEAPRTRQRTTTLGLGPAASAPAAGPLLFEDRSSAPAPVALKLVCPDCARSDFPTMQGFLNHCRLAHARVYGSHDECIQTCGVVVADDERDALLAAGVELRTVQLLSLQRIFARAVGLGHAAASQGGGAAAATPFVDEGFPQVSTHSSQTLGLGLHKDTPTLAPFLGKEVRRKVIHVYDEPEPIDILGGDDDDDDDVPTKPRPSWIPKRRKIHGLEDATSVNMAALALENTGDINRDQEILNGPSDQGSRFHVTRRIIISDRSLYLFPTKRPSHLDAKSHTHRWQISVSSPSYEQHVSTFLSRLTVTCATQPPVFENPITVSEPPFIACSTSDRPFLAQLTLKWVGDQNSDFSVVHWVELDQSKAARPVLGEEQILDVELDRHTNFLPVSTALPTVPWTCEGDSGSDATLDKNAGNELETASGEPPHIRLLRSIISRFPMTLQDLGGRQSPKVPYAVYPSPAKLLNVPVGRRKAIEWARAFAIRAEYDLLIASMPSSDDYVYLTTGDVFRWLESEGLFPRPRPKLPKVLAQPETSEALPLANSEVKTDPRFCAVCGVDVRFHSPGVPLTPHDGEQRRETVGFHCPAEMERHKTPLMHLLALVAPSRVPYWARRSDHHISQRAPRDIVLLAHPHLTRMVGQEAASLNLAALGTSQYFANQALLLLVSNKTRAEAESALAPYALVAVVLERVVRDLVGSAVQIARENQARIKTFAGRAQGSGLVSLLTPTHVLLGLMRGAEMGGPKEALLKCFARVGTVLETSQGGGGSKGGAVAPSAPAAAAAGSSQ